ncbi:hypothetical protein JTE90_000714 [Oedothorax gibbosus]|uniref:Uncharacterized protein n=1 Tax=Oedothorax gibbosus TaxID=931172 RepID=A0AAV6UQ17_9ARAC|nr:hypothetical protein JTE90_000714 [Oedothorax gibbosus]
MPVQSKHQSRPHADMTNKYSYSRHGREVEEGSSNNPFDMLGIIQQRQFDHWTRKRDTEDEEHRKHTGCTNSLTRQRVFGKTSK